MRLVRFLIRSKRAALASLAAFFAAGAVYTAVMPYRLTGEIGWTLTIIATLAAFIVARRIARWMWDASSGVLTRNAIQYRAWISKQRRG